MSLSAQRFEILDYIKDNLDYLEHNKVLLDIHQGNLKPYVQADLKACLSEDYYSKIQERLIVVNVLKRYIDKVSKVYALTPVRTTEKESDQKLLEEYEKAFEMNVSMNDADEYSNLFKGYLLDPYLNKVGEPKLRVSPFDRFLVYSTNSENPLEVDILIKFMGEKPIDAPDNRTKEGYRVEMRDVYYLYSDGEFLAIDNQGDVYAPAMEGNDGENPFGIIPNYYGFRSRIDLLPRQDTDLLNITKIIPVLLSDLSGAVLFQCFSIMYGVDVDSEDMVMSPNAFWSFKSDPMSEKTPQVGVVKPQADIDKVLNFIMQVFTFWLETKGIKVGALGSIDGSNTSSGIAKILDEMDTTELKKLSIKAFKKDEQNFWKVMKDVHNTWVDQGKVKGKGRFSEDFAVVVEFDEPQVVIDREKEVRTIKLEVDAGFLYPEKAIKKLYPDADETELKKHIDYFNDTPKEGDGEAPEDDNQDSKGVQPNGKKGDSKADS